jgi:nicotinic acid mononucleotide adenylyltransferase
MCFKNKFDTSYYHFTLPQFNHTTSYRDEMIKLIGYLGSEVLYKKTIDPQYKLRFLDISSDSDSLSAIINSLLISWHDYGVVVYKEDGEIKTDKIQHIRTQSPDLNIMKGSFNPPHLGHLYMAKQFEDTYFCISLNTYGKGIPSVDNLIDRINMILACGYKVILNRNPLFMDFYKVVRPVVGKDVNINFIVGMDTINRLAQDTTLVALSNMGCTYQIFERGEYMDPRVTDCKYKLHSLDIQTSSTYIRSQLLEESYVDLPEPVLQYLKSNQIYK